MSISIMEPIAAAFAPSLLLATEYELIREGAQTALTEEGAVFLGINMALESEFPPADVDFPSTKNPILVQTAMRRISEGPPKAWGEDVVRRLDKSFELFGRHERESGRTIYDDARTGLSRLGAPQGRWVGESDDIEGMIPWMNRGITVAHQSVGARSTISLGDLITRDAPRTIEEATAGVFLAGGLASRIFVTRADWNSLLRWRMGFMSLPTMGHPEELSLIALDEEDGSPTPFAEAGSWTVDPTMPFWFGLRHRYEQTPDFEMRASVGEPFSELIALTMMPQIGEGRNEAFRAMQRDRAAAFLLGARDWLRQEGEAATATTARIIRLAQMTHDHVYRSRALGIPFGGVEKVSSPSFSDKDGEGA